MALQQLEARLAAILEAKIDKKVEQVKDSLQETLTQLFQDMMIHREQPPQQDTTTTTTPAAKRSGVGRLNHRGRPSSEDSETDDDSTLDSSTDDYESSDRTTTASKDKTLYFCVKKSALDVHGGYWPNALHWYSADLSSPSSYGGGGGGAIANNQLTTLKTMPPHGFNHGAGVVVLDSVIYFLGGSPVSDIGLELLNSSVPRFTSDVFYFDTRYPHEGWKKASSMFAPRYNPAAYAVDGKIYVFGGGYGLNYPYAEVYDPNLHGGLWEPMDQIHSARRFPSDAAILTPVQADDYGRNMGRRQQLLFYNQSDATLCSYDLVSEEWTVLDEQFGHYYASFAAVGDVVYRYDSEDGRCVCAYDLVKRKWFSKPVQGLQKKRNVFPPLSDYCPTFLFHVGNGDLCLAWYGFYRGTNPALNSMFCTVFTVDKPPCDDDDDATCFVATIKSSYRIGYSNESDDCLHCFAV